jgi:hypothetical protein
MTRPRDLTLHLPLPKTTRRALVILEFACVALAVVAGLIASFSMTSVFLVLIVAAMAAAACHTRLALSIQNIAQVSVRALDERQRDARDRAFSRSLQILTATLGAMVAYALAAMVFKLWLPAPEQLWLVLWLPLMLSTGLPTAFVAWTEADTPPDLEQRWPGAAP